ncbi:hypothetical protein TNCV_4404351 [Trichonephila clavipes]|uniref:Uncharacterized protein n=1 Tax=Trichonephila clavipes TaxID=2585209 RepID=A0A8X6VFA2_TRICX|nr:hypothetical protein TNCV_4404351 [Trichonephila clavipes]
MSHYKDARGILMMDLGILNHGHVTPELAPPCPNFHATPNGRTFDPRQIQRATASSTRRVFSDPRSEHMTCLPVTTP